MPPGEIVVGVAGVGPEISATKVPPPVTVREGAILFAPATPVLLTVRMMVAQSPVPDLDVDAEMMELRLAVKVVIGRLFVLGALLTEAPFPALVPEACARNVAVPVPFIE